MNFSIIIFCYNEAGNISHVVQSAIIFLKQCGVDSELIIVDDGSNDGTTAICKQLAIQYQNIKLIVHQKNLGIGMALKSGYNAATQEYVCAIPGDGQFDINELHKVTPFYNNLYYSFYRPKTNYSWYRKGLTWLNRLFNHHILAVYLRDVNWIKVYRRDHLMMTNPQLKSSLIESEICSKLYKCGIMPVEMPSNYHQRSFGKAKGGNWLTLRKAIAETLMLWWEVKNFSPSPKYPT